MGFFRLSRKIARREGMESRTVNVRIWTVKCRLRTVNIQLWTVKERIRTINRQKIDREVRIADLQRNPSSGLYKIGFLFTKMIENIYKNLNFK